MSRTAAATTAGRTIVRTPAPAKPRRVSGPAGPPRRDPNAPPPRPDTADGRPARVPRARIDPTALAYADAALAPRSGGRPLAIPRARPLATPRARPLTTPRRPRAAARPQRIASGGVGLAYGGVAIASRMANVAIDVSASRLMDRVVRSRVWIGVIAVVLVGIVAVQVSLLKLNHGITRAVTTASTLEQSNSALRRDISRLSSGERIQPLAEAQGLVMPAPGDVGYLSAGDGRATAVRAAQRMTAPDPARAGLGGAVATTVLGSGTPATATSTPPITSTTAAVTTPAATGVSATGVPEAPATTATAQTTPPATQTPTVAPPPAIAATQAPAPAGAGGAAAQATPQTP